MVLGLYRLDQGSCPAVGSRLVVRVAIRVVLVPAGLVGRAPPQDGKSTDQEQADRGQARADDADVDLDGRPDRDVDLIVCGIGGASQAHQELKTDDADDGDAGHMR